MRIYAAAFLVLSACVDANEQAELNVRPYLGMTMAQFMRTTGLTPYDYFDAADGRTYLVTERGCNLQLVTKAIDKRGMADSWVIDTVNAQGFC